MLPCICAGTVPSVREGIVSSVACINQDRECCVGELDIAVRNCTVLHCTVLYCTVLYCIVQVRNCSSFVVYRLAPTPACNMGYCVGEGVPCPAGLASTNGYTPCDCK